MKRRKKEAKEEIPVEILEKRLVFYEDGQVFYIPEAIGDRPW